MLRRQGWASIARRLTGPRMRLWAGVVLSGLFLYLAVRQIDLGAVWASLAATQMRFVFLALGLVTLNTLGKSLRWRLLMGAGGDGVGLGWLTRYLLIGQMLNTLIPARLGDLGRAYWVGSHTGGRSFVLGTIVVEKLFDMVVYGLLFFWLLVLMPIPSWARSSALSAASLGVGLFVLLLGLGQRRAWLLDRIPDWQPGGAIGRFYTATTSRIRHAFDSLSVMERPGAVFFLLALSLGIWGIGVGINYMVLLALGIPPSLTAALLILIVLQIGIALPSVPGTIGIFQYLCILSLSLFNVDRATGLSYGILLQVVVFVPTTLLGIGFFWSMGLNRRELNSVVVPSEQVE